MGHGNADREFGYGLVILEVDSRSLFTGLLLIAFVCSHNLYLYCIQADLLDAFDKKSWYSAELLFFAMPLIFTGNRNGKSNAEVQLRNIFGLFLCLIMSLIAFNNFRFAPFLINGIVLQVVLLNGITFIYAILSLIFSDKNGNI